MVYTNYLWNRAWRSSHDPWYSNTFWLDVKYLWNPTITWSPCTLSIATLNTKYICVHCCCRVTKSYPTLCDPMDCSTPSFPLPHYLPEFAQTHVHCADGDIQPHSVVSFSPCPQSFPSSRSFPVNWLFASGGQSIGASP